MADHFLVEENARDRNVPIFSRKTVFFCMSFIKQADVVALADALAHHRLPPPYRAQGPATPGYLAAETAQIIIGDIVVIRSSMTNSGEPGVIRFSTAVTHHHFTTESRFKSERGTTEKRTEQIANI